MNTSAVGKLPPAERLLYWIREREAIRLRKEAGEPPPWTDDEILRTYRFTNVRRMDDRVSQWLLRNWYLPNRDHPNTLIATCLARHFNVPGVLGRMTGWVYNKGEPNWSRIIKGVREMKAGGNNVFNAAYMVRGIGTTDKTEMVVTYVTRPLYINPPSLDTSSVQSCVEALLPYWGFSTFMAGQVVADLRWALTGAWRDRNRWSSVGPGSARGLSRLLNITSVAKQEQWLILFRKHVLPLSRQLPIELAGRMEAIDWQNCLCEWDKYERTLKGEGRPKQLYRPGRE